MPSEFIINLSLNKLLFFHLGLAFLHTLLWLLRCCMRYNWVFQIIY